MTDDGSADGGAALPAGLTWRRWPAAEHLGLAAGGLLVMLGVASWLQVLGGVALTVAGSLFLLGSTARFYLPTTYSIGPNGLRVARLGAKRGLPWVRVEAFWEDENGALVSPCASPPIRARARGLFVEYPLEPGARDTVRMSIQRAAGDSA